MKKRDQALSLSVILPLSLLKSRCLSLENRKLLLIHISCSS